MKRTIGVIAFLLAGCSQGAMFDGTSVAKKVVSANLKDPESARWGEIRVEPLHEGFVACGTVNAKNSFGGYTGNSHFKALFTADGQGSAEISDSPGYGFLQQAECQILFEVAGRHSPKEKWKAEKAEMLRRVSDTATALAPQAVRMNQAGE